MRRFAVTLDNWKEDTLFIEADEFDNVYLGSAGYVTDMFVFYNRVPTTPITWGFWRKHEYPTFKLKKTAVIRKVLRVMEIPPRRKDANETV